MGKRYTKEETSPIRALTHEGHTIKEIAETLGRPEAGIRNIRYRKNLKADTKESRARIQTKSFECVPKEFNRRTKKYS